MNSYINRFRIVLLPLILSALLSGCTTTNQPQNTNAGAQLNKNASTSPASSAAAQPDPKNPPVGYLDGVDGEIKTGGSIMVSGWAADNEDGAPVKKVEVLLDSKVVAQATLGKERGDVATTTGHLAWQRAGWDAVVSLANVSSGAHKLSAIAHDSAGNSATLNGTRDIKVP